MTPDAELMGIFADEAEGRLANLAAGLLRLETGLDPGLVADLFREAHTIKGAAAVVGFTEVTGVAHRMEDLLDDLRSGRRPASAALVDTLLRTVDGLRAMIDNLRAGADVGADAERLRQALDSFSAAPGAPAPSDAPAPPPPDAPALPVAPDPLPGAAVPTPGPVVPAVPAAGPDRTEAIRVPLARLDTLVRLVGQSAGANLRVSRLLTDELGAGAHDLDPVRELAQSLNELQEVTMRARMVPVSTIIEPLQRTVRDLAHELGRPTRWDARGLDTELDRNVLAQLADPLVHLVRNALDHGIEPADERQAAGKPVEATVGIHAMQLGSEVIIAVSDDGRGIDLDAVRAAAAGRDAAAADLTDDDALQLIFRPGLSTASRVSELSGRGVGLDVVSAAVDALRGRIEVRSAPGLGTEFRIRVPITLAVLQCLIVAAGGRRYAVPMHSIVVIAETEVGVPVWVDGAPINATSLCRVLGHADAPGATRRPAVVVAGLARRHAFVVDEVVAQRDVVVKGLPRLVPRNPLLTGASIEPDGSVLCVLDGSGLVDQARKLARRLPADHEEATALDASGRPARRRSLLVVDDALTVRELQRAILERAGYEVRTAADGRQALDALRDRPADLVLTDVEMPVMDGFELTAAIRATEGWGQTPVLILTSRASEGDRRRGLEAGANGYLLKSSFDQGDLLAAVERLTGKRP